MKNDVLLIVERDDFEGDQSVTKRVYEIDLKRIDDRGYVEKTLVLDALRIANPDGIGAGDGYGTGEVFSLPVQSFETVVQLQDGRLLIGNDNNYPGNDARFPGTPDDTEFDIIDLRKTRIEPSNVTLVGAPRRQRATGPSTRSPRTRRRSCSAPTTSSPTSSRRRTACSSPVTRTRSAARRMSSSRAEFADRTCHEGHRRA